MVFSAPVVRMVHHEIRPSFRVLIGFWFLAAFVVAIFAQTLWIVALAGVTLIGSIGLAQWLLRPRPGSLARLVIDTSRRTIYWAHYGFEPEELPFSALKALILQSSELSPQATLWALDLTGRRVELGHAPGSDLEDMAVELSGVICVPLWYEQQSSSVVYKIDIDKSTYGRAIASDPGKI